MCSNYETAAVVSMLFAVGNVEGEVFASLRRDKSEARAQFPLSEDIAKKCRRYRRIASTLFQTMLFELYVLLNKDESTIGAGLNNVNN